MRFISAPGISILLPALAAGTLALAATPERHAYFGDLHVHTGWSVDTYQKGLLSTPDDAYRFALGEEMSHITGEKIRLASGPLDFLAVTDHSEYMGMGRTLIIDKDSPLYQTELARRSASPDPSVTHPARMEVFNSVEQNIPIPELLTPELRSYPWQQAIKIADRYYQPNKFTTFAGFEWTSQVDKASLHRVVLFGNAANLPEIPYSAFDSNDPVELWNWLDQLRAEGARVLAIPHNANISNGLMFPTEMDGAKLSRGYALQRSRNEPLVEIMQVKGTSETHPELSPNDEWADFAIDDKLIAMGKFRTGNINGSYMREAWLNGLKLQQDINANPYAFGVVASSDTHSTMAPYEESRYFGSKGADDSTPELRLGLTEKPPEAVKFGRNVRATLERRLARNGASLAGVWAEENTRESLFAALERKETFGTSGPRIRVRLFGGWDFAPADSSNEKAMASAGYGAGTAMGGVLPARPEGASAPVFLLAALMDPNSAPLQRLQVIKGWLENGETKELIYDVICSGGAEPDAKTRRCPDNEARVNLDDCSYPLNTGLPGMLGIWSDPDFDPAQPAFYYVRVLENPTCRWSTWDAIRLGIEIPAEAPATVQERAWTSPIWYRVD